jgi:hypothetical protein
VIILYSRASPYFAFAALDVHPQVWNLASEKPEQDVVTIPTTGTVEHIEVSGTSILWSVDEPISPDMPDNTVGMVYLLNTQDMSSIAIKVRWLCMVCFGLYPYL